MRRDFEKRAREKFSSANQGLQSRIDAMVADHIKKGVLKSGATAKNAVSLFEASTRTALDEILQEQAKLIEHRGSAWTAAGSGIRTALEEQIASAKVVLERPLRFAGANSDNAASKAVENLLSDTAKRLRSRLEEFLEGWSAPVPKGWNERHPFVYAIILLLAGALIGALANAVIVSAAG
jgi:hypothetical protein